MASSSSSWMPTQGKHQVSIGSSLGRALKTRKQGGTPPATNPKRSLPDKDFYSFRYTFKPESIDPMKPGTIDVRKKSDQTSVVVEHLGSQAGEAHVFTGNETPSKEWDCVLIYDEETGTYTLEKLDSFVKLQYERKRVPPARAVSSAAPSPIDQDAEGELDNDEDLEKELLGLAEDIPPPPPSKPKQVKTKRPRAPSPVRPPPQREEEEEEEEEEIIIPPRDPTPPPPPPIVKPPITKVPRPTTKSAPKARPQPTTTKSIPTPPITKPPPPVATPPVPTPVPVVSQVKAKPPPKKKTKREPELLVVEDPDVEVLEFGKRAKASIPFTPPVPAPAPTPPKSAGFALPGSSSSFVSPLPAPPSTVKVNQRPPPIPTQSAPDDDSDEEWEEVPGAIPTNTNMNTLTYESDDGDLFGEDEMEDALAQELDLGMEELDEGADDDQDFLAAALTKDESVGKIPMSLNNYAAVQGLGGDVDLSDEDFSSSDESDDD